MLSVSVYGIDEAMKNLASLRSNDVRKKILTKAARTLIRSTKDRTKNQIDVDGNPFGPYKTKTNHTRPRRRKMLVRLLRKLSIVKLDDYSVSIGFKSRRDENIGITHQYGKVIKFNRRWAKYENESGVVRGTRLDDLYTIERYQAKNLLNAGYKIRRKGKALWTPSIKWLTENIKNGQYRILMKVLEGSEGIDEWETKIPARPFLGITADELEVLAAAINDEYNKLISSMSTVSA